MHAHGWHGRPARRRAPRVPGAAAAAKRPGPGTAWRTGVMSNGRVVRDRGTAILAIGRSKCILMERLGWTGAGFAGIAVISLNDLAFYLNDANNPDGFPRIGRASALPLDGRADCAACRPSRRTGTARVALAIMRAFHGDTERGACL
ncbi:conserved hypothetical protein [Burkholderia cenocepacia]|nr:conserved hypothetical protein [Burkholderia cenocepacia]